MMEKKNHQIKLNHNSDESTESCDEITSCPHIRKLTSVHTLVKLVKAKGIKKECDECWNNFELPHEDDSLWMCLMCGNQRCGRTANKHALEHYNTQHPENHSLCINTKFIRVWCYDCDNQINIKTSKKLRRFSKFLSKVAQMGNEQPENINTRFIQNLTNTSFVNAVLQCLAQTSCLVEMLKENYFDNHYIEIPGGKLTFDDNTTVILEPLETIAGCLSNIPYMLYDTLRELRLHPVHSSRDDIYEIFIRYMNLYGDCDPHDAHEWLRHLFEMLRNEDIKRYGPIIYRKIRSITDPVLNEKSRNKVRLFYEQQASELSVTGQIFKGVLVSTLQCEHCSHTSHREETFLDLSLPVTENTIPPSLRRKADEIEDRSKYQIKREKKLVKKNNSDSNSGSEFDADVEDNLEDNENIRTNGEKSKGLESGYNSDKIYNESPGNNTVASPDVDDSGVPSPTIGMLCDSPLKLGSLQTSPASSEIGNIGSPILGHISPSEELPENFERPQSRTSFNKYKNGDLEEDLEKLSLLNNGDNKVDNIFLRKNLQDGDNKVDNIFLRKNLQDEACCKMDEDVEKEEKAEEVEDLKLWTATIAPRYYLEEGELSVESCLNQFTACELMTGENKVSCEVCTKRYGGHDKKTIYRITRKQLLILIPPAILTLHLNRFKAHHFRPTKVCKHIAFPTVLDLAPYCSKRSKDHPTFQDGQSEILYSLYAVVEHSGSIHNGHYVAYVKDTDLDSRWEFLPKYYQKYQTQTERSRESPYIMLGKWYYISNSHITEVQESEVLKAQAYLLFYERIS